jgi:transcriptional regulator with XRE-family HTH domain
MLHDELRSARERAKLTQGQLAKLAGIPRNQVSRAERGDNITLDTLRKMVVHLPVTALSLIGQISLTIDVIPQPERVLLGTMDTVQHLCGAMASALETAMEAREAVVKARIAEPLGGEPQSADQDPIFLLQQLKRSMDKLVPFPKSA